MANKNTNNTTDVIGNIYELNDLVVVAPFRGLTDDLIIAPVIAFHYDKVGIKIPDEEKIRWIRGRQAMIILPKHQNMSKCLPKQSKRDSHSYAQINSPKVLEKDRKRASDAYQRYPVQPPKELEPIDPEFEIPPWD